MKFFFSGCFFLLLFAGCVSAKKPVVYSDGFPDNWWAPIPAEQVAGWEIPPQAADRGKAEVVLSKRTELGAFSNLQSAGFTLDGAHYASVEALWQSMKYPESLVDVRAKNKKIIWTMTRQEVMKLSGFDAKKAGDRANENMKALGITWVTYKGKKLEYATTDSKQHYEIILKACRAKLEANPQLKQLLLQTKNLKFMADHKQKDDAPPAYRYHEIYMKLRDELSSQKSH